MMRSPSSQLEFASLQAQLGAGNVAFSLPMQLKMKKRFALTFTAPHIS